MVARSVSSPLLSERTSWVTVRRGFSMYVDVRNLPTRTNFHNTGCRWSLVPYNIGRLQTVLPQGHPYLQYPTVPLMSHGWYH